MAALITNGFSAGFDLRRVVGTTRGIVPDVDGDVLAELKVFNDTLSLKVFDPPVMYTTGGGLDSASGARKRKAAAATKQASPPSFAADEDEPLVSPDEAGQAWQDSSSTSRSAAAAAATAAAAAASAAAASTVASKALIADLGTILAYPLTPHRKDGWADGSLLEYFENAAASASQGGQDMISLSEVVDTIADLSKLKYALRNEFSTKLYAYDLPTRTLLGGSYPAVVDFLVAYASTVMGLEDFDAVKNFILSAPLGLERAVRYTAISAARSYLARKQLIVPGLEDDGSDIVTAIGKASALDDSDPGFLSLEAGAFSVDVDAIVQTPIFNSEEAKLVAYAESQLGPIPASYKPALIQYIKTSAVKVTQSNILYFAPGWIQQIARSQQIEDPAPPATPDQADAEFNVELLDDDRSQILISRTSVRCAAQLYFGMVLGDELEVFNAVNFFTHKYLVRGSLTIEDSKLRDDLQAYVFSNRFNDRRTKRVVDRTRPSERAMFYRQVFNSGAAQSDDDVVLNQEFPKLWKVLMLESAKFLERAQISPNPDTYVSRQNIVQAVEDLQYNLSTHCTGMAMVIAPLIHDELQFVIRNILSHPEVVRQVVPSGGTWWRVVEALWLGMKNQRPKSTVIYNKARGGNDIIRAIADYDSSTFSQEQKFAEFIGNVERFITTQSILQEAITDDLVRAGASGDSSDSAPPPAAAPASPGTPPDGASAAGQEWNF